MRNEHYNGSIPFPEDMPAELVDHVRAQKDDKNQVWIDCHGENPADVESLGKINYFPKSRGFPAYYFPYLNQVSCGLKAVGAKLENQWSICSDSWLGVAMILAVTPSARFC